MSGGGGRNRGKVAFCTAKIGGMTDGLCAMECKAADALHAPRGADRGGSGICAGNGRHLLEHQPGAPQHHPRSAPKGTLRVHLRMTFGLWVLPLLVAAFRQRYPDIHIEQLLSESKTCDATTSTSIPGFHRRWRPGSSGASCSGTNATWCLAGLPGTPAGTRAAGRHPRSRLHGVSLAGESLQLAPQARRGRRGSELQAPACHTTAVSRG